MGSSLTTVFEIEGDDGRGWVIEVSPAIEADKKRQIQRKVFLRGIRVQTILEALDEVVPDHDVSVRAFLYGFGVLDDSHLDN